VEPGPPFVRTSTVARDGSTGLEQMANSTGDITKSQPAELGPLFVRTPTVAITMAYGLTSLKQQDIGHTSPNQPDMFSLVFDLLAGHDPLLVRTSTTSS
jgi:hypothetical protein